MTRLMADAINPNNIPVGKFALVAGYVDGPRSQWPAAGWVRHASSILVRIAVFASTNDGIVLDVEQGDATPAQAPGWVQRRRAAGVDPTVYCSESAWASVQAAFRAANVSQPHYWVAAYPGGGAVIPAGAIAHQYADPVTSGGQWDLSVVADYWPGVDQGAIMDWSDPIQNPIYDPANKNPADERSRATYTAAQYIQGPWVRTLTLPAQLAQLAAQLTSLQGALTADEATLVGLLQGVDSDTKAGVLQVVAAISAGPTGAVDVKTLAAALAPLLPADASPAAIGEAVVAAFQAHLATNPPAGGTP